MLNYQNPKRHSKFFESNRDNEMQQENNALAMAKLPQSRSLPKLKMADKMTAAAEQDADKENFKQTESSGHFKSTISIKLNDSSSEKRPNEAF